jgi:hypothetical protein
MTREVTDQLYIDLGYFTPEEYYVYIAEAESVQASEATMSITAERIIDAQADLSIETTVTASLVSIEGIEMFAFSEAQIAVQVDRIRDNNTDVTSVFDVAADFVRLVDVFADAESQASQQVSVERSREFDSVFEAAFSFDGSTLRIRDNSSDLLFDVDLQATLSNIRGVDIVQENFASMSIDAVKTTDTTIDLSSDNNLEILGGLIVPAESNFVSTSRLLASVPRFRYFFKSAQGQVSFGSGSTTAIAGDIIDNTTYKFGGGSLYLPRSTSGGPTGIVSVDLPENHLDLPSFTASTSNYEISFWIKRSGPSGTSSLGTTGTLMIWGGFSSGPYTLSTSSNSTDSFWAVDSNLNFWFRESTTTSIPPVKRELSGNIVWTDWNHFRLLKYRVSDSIIRRTVIQINGVTAFTTNGSHNTAITPAVDVLNFSSMFNQDIWIDDFYLAVGSSASTGLDSVPTEELLYIPASNTSKLSTVRIQQKFNNTRNDEEGIFLTQIAQASLISSVNLVGSISGSQKASASISSDSNVSCAISVDRGADLEAFANGTLTADVTRIQTVDAQLESDSAISADAAKINEVESTQSSESTVSVDISVQRSAIIDTDSIASTLAVVVKTGSVIIDSSVVATQTTQAEKITDITDDFNSESTLVAASDRSRDNTISANIEFSASTDALRIRQLASDQNLESSVSADVVKTVSAEISASSEFTAFADASGGVVRAIALLASLGEITVSGDRIRSTDSQLLSETTVSVDSVKITDIDSDQNSEFNTTLAYDRIRSVEITTDSISTVLGAVAKIVDKDIDFTATTVISITAEKITDDIISLNLSATVSADTVKTAQAESVIVSVSGLSAEGTTNITGEATMSATATQTTVVVKTTDVISTNQITTELTVTPDITRLFASLVVSFGTLTLDAQRFRTTGSDNSMVTEFDIDSDRIRSFECDFGSLFTPSVSVRKIYIDIYVYKIPREIRTYRVSAETREYVIQKETRIYTIRR